MEVCAGLYTGLRLQALVYDIRPPLEEGTESDARSVHWTLSCEMKHQNGSLILMQNISGGDTVVLRIVPPLSAFWDLGPRQYASQWRPVSYTHLRAHETA